MKEIGIRIGENFQNFTGEDFETFLSISNCPETVVITLTVSPLQEETGSKFRPKASVLPPSPSQVMVTNDNKLF